MILDRLGPKLLLAVGATALATIGAFSAFESRAESRSVINRVETSATQLSDLVLASTEYDMLLNQREQLSDAIRRLARPEGIERIRVMNKAGTILYSSDPSEVGRAIDRNAESCTRCHSAARPLERLDPAQRTRLFRPRADGPRLLGVITPIYNAPGCWTAACHAHPPSQRVLGVLDVTMPLTAADAEIRQGRLRILLFASIAVAALCLIVWLFLERWVQEPVRGLLEATHRVAGGDLNAQIPAPGNDELGRLAESFNHMTQKLSEARLQLFQSDKLASLGRLAAGIAHELNNPLTGVLTYSSYLQKRTADQPELNKDLDVIVRETVRSREIVKSLLDFARQSVPRKREVEVGEIVDRAAAVIANQLTLKHVKLVKSLPQALPRLNADANQIQQVFLNLFTNAADAMPEAGGTITVSGAATNGSVELKIADDGAGMPPEVASRVFEPFFSTKGQKGTGLGLSVVLGIVENHGGTISVESRPGAGTTFSLRLPAKAT